MDLFCPKPLSFCGSVYIEDGLSASKYRDGNRHRIYIPSLRRKVKESLTGHNIKGISFLCLRIMLCSSQSPPPSGPVVNPAGLWWLCSLDQGWLHFLFLPVAHRGDSVSWGGGTCFCICLFPWICLFGLNLSIYESLCFVKVEMFATRQHSQPQFLFEEFSKTNVPFVLRFFSIPFNSNSNINSVIFCFYIPTSIVNLLYTKRM